MRTSFVFPMCFSFLLASNALSAEVKVLLPPPVKSFVQEAARAYEKDHPDTSFRIEEAASLALIDKARSGFAFDVVLATGPLIKNLQEEGFARDPEKVAEGFSVIAYRKGSTPPNAQTAEDVRALVTKAGRISLSDPAMGGASSNFFMNVAKAQGLEAEVRQKAVFTAGGHGADPVNSGEAEYGVAQKSELGSLTNVDSVPLIPADPKSSVPYFVALSAKSDAAAGDFIRFLKSEKVTNVKAAQGLR